MRRVLRRLLLTGIALALASTFAQPATPSDVHPRRIAERGPWLRPREAAVQSSSGDALQAPMTMEGGLRSRKTTAGGSLPHVRQGV